MRLMMLLFVVACGGTSRSAESPQQPAPDVCKDKIAANASMNLTTNGSDHVLVEFSSKPSDAELAKLGLTALDDSHARGLLTRAQVDEVCKAPGVKWVDHETQGTELKPN